MNHARTRRIGDVSEGRVDLREGEPKLVAEGKLGVAEERLAGEVDDERILDAEASALGERLRVVGGPIRLSAGTPFALERDADVLEAPTVSQERLAEAVGREIGVDVPGYAGRAHRLSAVHELKGEGEKPPRLLVVVVECDEFIFFGVRVSAPFVLRAR